MTALDALVNVLLEQVCVPAYVDSLRVFGCGGKNLARK